MQLLLYAGAAIVILGMVGTGVYKIRESGKESVRLEWTQANAKAAAEAEADRKRQDDLRQAQDKEATKRLADAKRSNAALLTSLESHIKVAKLPTDCRLPPSLHADVNAALAGSQGERPSAMPSGPGTAAPAR